MREMSKQIQEISGKFPGNFLDISGKHPGNLLKFPGHVQEISWFVSGIIRKFSQKKPRHVPDISQKVSGQVLEMFRKIPRIFPAVSWNGPGRVLDISLMDISWIFAGKTLKFSGSVPEIMVCFRMIFVDVPMVFVDYPVISQISQLLS